MVNLQSLGLLRLWNEFSWLISFKHTQHNPQEMISQRYSFQGSSLTVSWLHLSPLFTTQLTSCWESWLPPPLTVRISFFTEMQLGRPRTLVDKEPDRSTRLTSVCWATPSSLYLVFLLQNQKKVLKYGIFGRQVLTVHLFTYYIGINGCLI